jgi:hypothetical protein
MSFTTSKSSFEFYPLVGGGTGPKVSMDNSQIGLFGGTNNGTNHIIIENDGDVKIGQPGSATPKISLHTSGSAEFAGTVEVSRIENSGSGANPWLRGFDGTTETCTISNDGSARFAGALDAGGVIDVNAYDSTADKNASLINFGSLFVQKKSGSAATTPVFQGNYGGSNNITSQIKVDGSASFAGGLITLNPAGSANFTGYVQANRTSEGSFFYGSYNGDAKYDVRTDGEVRIASSVSPSIKLSANGSATFADTISLTNGGAGLKFPAANTGNADPNTLDDYEEGAFTPSIAFNGSDAGVTYSTRTSSYTKIGRSVTITLQLFVSNKGSATGDLQIIGLPFAPRNTEAIAPIGAFGFTPTALGSPCLVLLGTTMKLGGTDDAVGSYYTNTAFSTGFQLRGSFCYETDA